MSDAAFELAGSESDGPSESGAEPAADCEEDQQQQPLATVTALWQDLEGDEQSEGTDTDVGEEETREQLDACDVPEREGVEQGQGQEQQDAGAGQAQGQGLRQGLGQQAEQGQEQQGEQGQEQAKQARRDTHARRASKMARLLRQEVDVLGRCCHPHVVRLVAACLTPPRLCLVMELMETSLEKLLYGNPGQLLPLPTVLHIAVQIVQGLEYLHPTIVHRDLKPANVLINGGDTSWPVAKLTDFGLARIRSVTLPTLSPEAGTPAYTAPECYDVNNSIVRHHADIYSLGVLLWAMLTGQQPWQSHTIPALAYKVAVLKERLPLEGLSERRCPPKLRRLIRQCWDHDPRRRPAAAEALKDLLLTQQQVRPWGMAG
ncbi:Mitogen-activated protein kinase kinase kinase 10 [Tetrabaena socialis]|uniref:Mitogen-activated protein kinase kinase kinase 10 n=1 Tax=Tetrabaena socialis TaxID=47790 RepID=A0A2J8AFN9_9CHLO|nr:Mitogen-activated protein kinase kinase kinase 10 [Tetrabaena socialis]|eukprot:PNH11334.1 Mitogen-activated protein kinase kinase kinase 10 [Tetrabaena socialis]